VTRILDRYLLRYWVRIFLLTTLGLPLVQVLIEATEQVARLLDRDLTAGAIALSYLYKLPEAMAQMIPAACLFATTFTFGPLSRNNELTAAKAGGLSFYRLLAPLLVASIVASGLSFAIGELSTRASARALEIQKERRARGLTTRFNFVYRGEGNWLYTVRQLDTETRQMTGIVLEREGTGAEYPTLAIVADSIVWVDTLPGRWRLRRGASHFLADSTVLATFQFRQARFRGLTQQPRDLLVEPKDPSEMDYRELGAHIEALRRSGAEVGKLAVDRALKLAIPATCIVIVLFGAPLALTAPRAGAAVGVAISLGTTVTYLLLVNLTRAIGASGVMDPTLAAWAPNGFFFALALLLLWRVRT
jgi:lipopolysaccharide export system permease protein